MKKEMKSEYVIDLYAKLENLGVEIWIDGGWAVDALFGKITRSHSDLDIAVDHKNLEKLRKYLETLDYKEIERDEDKRWDFVMGDDCGHEIDVHSFSFDDDGDVIEENHWAGYERKSLSGLGHIDGHPVRCTSVEQLIKNHDESKRKFAEKDYADLDILRKMLQSQ